MSLEQAVVDLERRNAALLEEVVRFRDAAMGLNNIHASITAGRQAVADGKYFSVPGNGAYMRLYRRTGSSAELIAEFPDRGELNSVINQLGPLLGRGVVGGSGDLMAEGAFGLGNSGVSLTDWNDTPNVNCFLIAGSSNTPNQPPGGATNGWQVSNDAGTYKKQYGSGINYRDFYVRVFDRNEWSDWDEVVLGSRLDSNGLSSLTASMGEDPGPLANEAVGFRHIHGSNRPPDIPDQSDLSWASIIALPRSGSRTGGAIMQTLRNDIYTVRFVSGVATLNKLYSDNNTTVDSNGFIKAASPIFRLANTSEPTLSDNLNFTGAGAGAANSEALGVTATHDDVGVYTIHGSLGFATAGWELGGPKCRNGLDLLWIDAQQSDDGTITVRTYHRTHLDAPPFARNEINGYADGDPIDIPEDRFIAIRLSMPEPEQLDDPGLAE